MAVADPIGVLTGGDGALSCAPVFVAEACWSLKLLDGVFVTPDYQFIGNPAYNAARGPRIYSAAD